MAEFDLGTDGGLFKPVIDRHDRRIADLKWMQARFREPDVADALAAYLREDYPKHSDWQSYWRQNDGLAGAAFRNPTMWANRHAFDPWDGWWTGQWHQPGGSSSAQKHVWDVTRPFAGAAQGGGTRHIQPVTQSTTGFFHSGNTADGWAANRVDLGINVFSRELGITGWVSKRQGGTVVELPHVGYMLNPHTLVWITTDQAVPGSSVRFMMFFEWVAGDRRTYGIHGRFFMLSGGGISNSGRGLTGWAEYAATSPVR